MLLCDWTRFRSPTSKEVKIQKFQAVLGRISQNLCLPAKLFQWAKIREQPWEWPWLLISNRFVQVWPRWPESSTEEKCIPKWRCAWLLGSAWSLQHTNDGWLPWGSKLKKEKDPREKIQTLIEKGISSALEKMKSIMSWQAWSKFFWFFVISWFDSTLAGSTS